MLLSLFIIIVGIIIDRVTKYYAVTRLSIISTYPIIDKVFHLTYTTNTGGAFSLLNDHLPLLTVFSLLLFFLIMAVIIMLPKKKDYRVFIIGLSMIASGAVGNLIDRITLGYVIDFFDFRLIGFAIFNVADIFVVIGCTLLVYAIWFNKMPQHLSELNLPFRKKD